MSRNTPAPAIAAIMSKGQLEALRHGFHGEEKEHFATIIEELNKTLATMPVTYEQDGNENPTVYLHYFIGNMDWYITELDSETKQYQAFGSANLGYGAELGYINLHELAQNGVELDLYFTPKLLSEVKK